MIYIFANSIKILVNFRVWYSNNRQAIFLKKSSSFLIVFSSLFRIMPRTIKFNYQFSLGTVKICNILSKNFLTQKTYRMCTQKIIP